MKGCRIEKNEDPAPDKELEDMIKKQEERDQWRAILKAFRDMEVDVQSGSLKEELMMLLKFKRLEFGRMVESHERAIERVREIAAQVPDLRNQIAELSAIINRMEETDDR